MGVALSARYALVLCDTTRLGFGDGTLGILSRRVVFPWSTWPIMAPRGTQDEVRLGIFELSISSVVSKAFELENDLTMISTERVSTISCERGELTFASIP